MSLRTATSRSRLLPLALSAAVALFSGACADRTLHVEEMREPQLRAIHVAMEQTIERANADPQVKWHAGWTGNIAVNASDDRDRGLCYQWRDLIWHGVYNTVRAQGWDTTGITINYDTFFEHHGVLVWDPRYVSKDRVLDHKTEVYVLDGWARGQADVYRLDQWIEDQLVITDPPRIRELSPPGLPGSKQKTASPAVP